MKYRAEQLGEVEEFRALGLTSRKNLCLHPSVKKEKSGAVVDARCRSLTAGFVKEKKDRGEDVDVCVYHDVSYRSMRHGECIVANPCPEPRPTRAPQPNTERSVDPRWPS